MRLESNVLRPMTTLSFLVLSCGAPTASHLLAYFASSLPNINTLKLYFYTPAPVLPCRCGQIRCRCVSMRADAVDAVISHTALQLIFISCDWASKCRRRRLGSILAV